MVASCLHKRCIAQPHDTRGIAIGDEGTNDDKEFDVEDYSLDCYGKQENINTLNGFDEARLGIMVTDQVMDYASTPIANARMPTVDIKFRLSSYRH